MVHVLAAGTPAVSGDSVPAPQTEVTDRGGAFNLLFVFVHVWGFDAGFGLFVLFCVAPAAANLLAALRLDSESTHYQFMRRRYERAKIWSILC